MLYHFLLIVIIMLIKFLEINLFLFINKNKLLCKKYIFKYINI